MTLRRALWFPLFDELADPRVAVGLAVEAEAAGWDAVFLWDHIAWREPVSAVGDPWIVLAAAAQATERVLLGPMVTPLARRRPVKVARETATLDALSGGRLVLGVGLGSDRFGREFSATGEQTDDRVRAAMLDESIDILRRAWTGEPVHHHGTHHTVDGIAFRPAPARPIPIWSAGFPGNRRPMQRAAALDGFFPVNLDSADQLAEIAAAMAELRAGDGRPFDLVVGPDPDADLAPYAAAGATWALTGFESDVTLDRVRGVLRDGPGDHRAE